MVPTPTSAVSAYPVDQLGQGFEQARCREGQLQAEDAFLDKHVADQGQSRDVRGAEHAITLLVVSRSLSGGRLIVGVMCLHHPGKGFDEEVLAPRGLLVDPSCLASWYEPCPSTALPVSSWATNSGLAEPGDGGLGVVVVPLPKVVVGHEEPSMINPPAAQASG